MLQQMFDLQRRLNIMIGRDTVGADQSLKDEWLFQYIVAFEDELYELSTSTDPSNSLIEIIDALHFGMSICQILNITASDIEQEVPFTIESFHELYSSTSHESWDLDQLYKDVGALRHQIEFKWWSKFIKENPDKQFKVIKDREQARQTAINIMISLFKLAFLYGLTPIQIFRIYTKKHQANIDRQENDYDDRNKTEADNQAIIVDIKNYASMSDIDLVREIDKDLNGGE